MFHRIVNPRRVLMVLASARKTLNLQDHAIFRNTCPQIRQVRTLPRVFPPSNYSSVAEAKVEEKNQVLSILKAKDWGSETEEKLNGLTDISVDHVVSALTNQNPVKALSFFDCYKKHPSYKPSSPVYNAMLRAVSKKTHMAKFWELAEEMKSHGFLMEKHTYLLIKGRLRKDGTSQESAKVFIWMTENCQEVPIAKTCYDVIQFMANEDIPDIDAATRVLEAYKNCGGSMDKSVYDSLQRCLTRAGLVDEAMKLMDTMTKEGFAPDNVTYGQLIFGLCRANRLGEACNVVNEMKEKGCVPLVNTWTILITGHCKAKETDRALALLSEMTESGCAHDPFIIKNVVDHLCSMNREMDAYNLLCKSTEEKKIRPTYSTYSVVIKTLIQSGMLKEACKVFGLMKEYNHFAIHFASLSQAIIDFIGKSGTVDDAYSLLWKTKEKGFNGKICIAMVEAFWKADRQGDAHELVSKLPPYIAKTPQIFSILEGTSTDKLKSEDPTEKSPKDEKSPKGKVAKKGKKSKTETKNGGSVKENPSNEKEKKHDPSNEKAEKHGSSSDKAEKHDSSSDKAEQQEDHEAKAKESSC